MCSVVPLNLMHSVIKQRGVEGGQRMASGCRWSCGHVWAGGAFSCIPNGGKQKAASTCSHSSLHVTKVDMQREMETRPSSYHLITGNSSHCAEEITAAYDCLLPIHLTAVVRRESARLWRRPDGTLTSDLSAGPSSVGWTTHSTDFDDDEGGDAAVDTV